MLGAMGAKTPCAEEAASIRGGPRQSDNRRRPQRLLRPPAPRRRTPPPRSPQPTPPSPTASTT